MENLYFLSIFKIMLTMFLGLSQFLHICSLLWTSWSVSFFCNHFEVWFFTLFPRNTWNNFKFAVFCFEFAIFLNTKTNREKLLYSSNLQCFWIFSVQSRAGITVYLLKLITSAPVNPLYYLWNPFLLGDDFFQFSICFLKLFVHCFIHSLHY